MVHAPSPLPPLAWPAQCQGVTQAGQPCKVTSRQSHVHAASLRRGSSFCQHHQPDKFTGVQCAGLTKHGVRCRVFSGPTYANAAPLRNGKQFCRSHATRYVRCAGTTGGEDNLLVILGQFVSHFVSARISDVSATYQRCISVSALSRS